MARPPAKRQFLMLSHTMRRRRIEFIILLSFLILILLLLIRRRRRRTYREPCWYDPIIRSTHLSNMIGRSDLFCIEQLRMDRHCFRVLCSLVQEYGGLKPTKNVSVEEMVAIFLHIIAFDEKNREIKFQFQRSQETISRHFHNVLRAILKLWRLLLRTPHPIRGDTQDTKWKWFKNCIGALDGTYVKVNVRAVDKPRYRSRKNDIATNVLGACGPDMQFIYVLAGWEGSAADGRILRDALCRSNGLKVPQGCYYLVDAGYKNCEGFLAPYRGQRYHLQEWTNPPTKKEEIFNMRHASARNVIERTFGLLKIRWSIMRNPSYYSVETHTDIILACCYLHNLIRQQMSYEPFEEELEAYMQSQQVDVNNIDCTETSTQWTRWRDELAQEMWDAWKSRRPT